MPLIARLQVRCIYGLTLRTFGQLLLSSDRDNSKISGRRRFIVTATLDLLIMVILCAASAGPRQGQAGPTQRP
jgi:hypothetical protein